MSSLSIGQADPQAEERESRVTGSAPRQTFFDQVGQDLFDHQEVFDVGNDPGRPAADRAGSSGITGQLWLARAAGEYQGRYEQIQGEIHSRFGHQCGQ